LVAALRVAAQAKAAGASNAVVVTVFSDSAAKYLSERFWQELNSEAENWP
jgi:cysteine synthase